MSAYNLVQAFQNAAIPTALGAAAVISTFLLTDKAVASCTMFTSAACVYWAFHAFASGLENKPDTVNEQALSKPSGP